MNKINTAIHHNFCSVLGVASFSAAAMLLAACAANPVQDPGVAAARAALTDLQSNPRLASRAPVAIHDAEIAVNDAEQPQTDPAVTTHLVYIANRKVQTARAQAQTAYTEDQRKALSEENGKIQLDARTSEADAAKRKSDQLQVQTDAANRMSEGLQMQNDAANQQNDRLQSQLEALQAKKTDRGMVLTLGDVLFSTGRADLKPGGIANLDRLVSFLGDAPDRTVRIEGHTDSRGSDSLNQALSQKRADSVSRYLTGRGVASARVTAVGESSSSPIADNSTEAGRQANRRVEVIIQNPS